MSPPWEEDLCNGRVFKAGDLRLLSARQRQKRESDYIPEDDAEWIILVSLGEISLLELSVFVSCSSGN